MKRFFALVFIMVYMLGLTACSTASNDVSKPQTDPTNNSTVTNESENTSTAHSVPEPPAVTDGDEAIKAALIEKYGLPFAFKRHEGMAMWRFELSETSAEREYVHSFEDTVSHQSLTWDIANGELVISGDWNEIFTLDIENDMVISKTDGEKYRIWEADNSLTMYGALQQIYHTYGFPLKFEMLDGVEVTQITLYEDCAERKLLNDEDNPITEKLTWQISDDILSISGEWEESFRVDADAGTLTSLSTKKVYKLAVPDEE